MAGLEGKRIVVTGGAGGIGNAAVRLFVEQGAQVACTCHSTQPEVPQAVACHRRDFADRAAVETAFARITDELGGLDVLLRAAGIHGSRSADEVDEAA